MENNKNVSTNILMNNSISTKMDTVTKINTLYDNNNIKSTSNTVTKTNPIYNKNDICLRISPFDSFKRISLYTLNDDDSYKILDVNRGDYYNYYLQFGKKKPIIINEFKDTYTENEEIVLTSSNEIIFKITQDKAKEILSLSDNVFYLVREIISDNTRVLSQELFSGRWTDDTEYEYVDYQSIIKSLQSEIKRLMEALDNANAEIVYLNEEILMLQSENTSLRDQNTTLQEEFDKLLMSYNTEYEATELKSDVTYINVNVDQEEMSTKIKNLFDDVYDPANPPASDNGNNN